MSRKTELIKRIKDILNPDDRPELVVFWDSNHHEQWSPGKVFQDAPKGFFYHKGKLLSKKECTRIPGKTHMFVVHEGR